MRMKLHKSTRIGDYEIYPVYDIDFSGISADTGYTQEYSNDAVGTNAYKYRQWKSINNNLVNHIPATIPKIEPADGNIIPFWHRYTNIVEGRYTLDNDNLSSYAAIEQGIRPDDWGTNPNYIDLERTSASSHNIIRPSINKLTSSWSSSTSYYEDTKRTILRMFYTDTGCSFTVGKHTVSTGSNYYYARAYSVGTYPHPSSTTRTGVHYSYTDTNNNMLNTNYYIQDGLAVNPASTSEYQSWSTYPDGYNCTMIFVHFKDSGTDFFGVAIVQMSDFTENSYPVAIHVSAWDETFWGNSIISGGESGAGSWGNNNIPAGGGGTFSFTSDNRGDSSGTAIAAEMTKRIHGFNTAAGGLYNIHVLTDSEMRDVMNALYYNKSTTTQILPDFIERCKNSVYNPLSAFLAINAIPHNLIMRKTTPSILTAAGFNISESINHVTPPTYAECEQVSYLHLGSYDFNANHVFDAFPDFAPYTKIKLHLPYIGIIDIDTNAVMYGSIAVTYFCDAISGNLTAFVWCCDKDGNSTYKYTASGNCAYSYPLFALAQDGSAIGKLIGSGLNLAGGMLTGSANMLAGGAGGIADGLLSAQFGRRETQSAGAFGGNVSILGDSVCYLEIIRPVWINPENYQKLHGIAADLSHTIADRGNGIAYDGYLEISAIDLENVTCTDDEKREIADLLKQGVIIRGAEI